MTKAIIWDMDGVIVDSAQDHLKSWQEVFGKSDITFSQQDFRSTFGQRNDTIVSGVLGEKASPEDIARIGREKEAAFRRRISKQVKPLPGVIKLIDRLKESGFKQAVASSAPIRSSMLPSPRAS